MLDKKTLNLLEMAERGELPDSLQWGSDPLRVRPEVLHGKLTESGKTLLSAHRYEQQIESGLCGIKFERQDFGDLTAIHSQLGELKYKVEKLEGIVNKNPQVYGSFAEKPCTCSCTKPEQPALEWEVWLKPNAFICACETNGIAGEMLKARARLVEFSEERYEVRHNPKRK